ncbi:hypothetical protein ACVW0Y_004711 [Pseudomonas sp. TE3786]
MNQETEVTKTSTFCVPDGIPLFSVNAGVPVSDALEQSAILLECIKYLIVIRETTDPDKHATVLQYLTEMAEALVDATRAVE